MRAAKKRPSLGGKARLFWSLAKKKTGVNLLMLGPEWRVLGVGAAGGAGLEGPGGDFSSWGGRNGTAVSEGLGLEFWINWSFVVI